jgi:hypothetical protein
LLLAPIATLYFDRRIKNPTWVKGEAEPYLSLRNEIPESASVYCDEGAEACWFLLRRQNYMSQMQSSGIVFSREMALEAKRRAELLFNVGFEGGIFSKHWPNSADSRLPEPSRGAFIKLCQDPALDYIITRHTQLPFAPDKIIRKAGMQYNIYFCYQGAIEYKLGTRNVSY